MDIRASLLQFFTAQFATSDPSNFVSLFIDGACHFSPVSNLEKAVDLVLSRRESANVYYGVATRSEDLTAQRKRGGKNECAEVGCLWLDVDIGTVGHKAKDLPPDEASVVPLLVELGIAPSLIVATGGGLHAYYRLVTPFKLGTPESVARFETLNRAINNRFAELCAARGWAADSQTANVDRILRVPFTYNMKDGQQRPVYLVDDNNTTHDFDDLETRFVVRAPQVPAISPPTDDEVKAHVITKLKRIRKPGLAEIARAVVDGESFAAAGERDVTLHKIASAVATIAPDAEPETLAEVFRPSFEKWAEEGHDDVENLIALAVDKIARSQAFGKKKQAEAQALEDHARQLQIRLARTATGSNREGAYTEEELTQFAAEQNCPRSDFERRWVVQKNKAFWVYSDAGYIGPRHRDELDCALPVDLSPAPVDWTTMTEKGPRKRTAKEVAALYGTVASRIVADLTIDRSYLDPATKTFYEAVCPRRKLEPVFNTQVDTWLRLLGGTEADRFLDWIATVGDLTRQTCALYLSGAPGAGKGMFAKGIARLWNEGAPTKLANILNGFNHDLTRCPLVFADERLPNKPGISSDLRELIGTESMTLARKFMDNAELRGAIRIIIAGNNEHLLAVDKDEELTPDDLEAIAGRFLHIDVSVAAKAYIDSIGGVHGATKDWVSGDVIAKHALWLHANRTVVPGKRFLVEGHMSRMHELLATAGKWPSLACEWVVRQIISPAVVVLNSQGVIVGNGEVLINTTCMIDNWELFIKSSGRPSAALIGRAMGNMSTGTTRRNGVRYHVIDVGRLLRWADRSQIGDPEALAKTIAGDVVTRALGVVK